MNNPIQLVCFTLIAFSLILYLFARLRKGQQREVLNKIDDLSNKIHEDIKFSVAPKFIDASISVNDLVEFAIEIWRVEQRISKVLSGLPENQKKGLENSIQKLKRCLQKYDLEIVDYTNQKYNEGLNLDVLSVEKDLSIADSIVKETIEPTVLCKGQVIRKAKIILLSK